MKRIILEGAYNFRDIGGYKTKDGKSVKFGKIYRSDELSHLTDNDITTIEELGIKTIIDYRNEAERVDNEDCLWSDVKVVYLDPKADTAAMASSESLKGFDRYKNKLTASIAKTLMTEQNYQFVLSDSSKEAYRKMFDILLNEEQIPTVQHCRGGKDRTGYGIALILLVLGVSREQVIDDYLLTNECKKEKNEKSLKQVYEQTHDDDLVLALRYLKEAQLEFLLKALDTIDNEFDGIDSYVKKELGLSSNQINKLKDLYLEEEGNG